MQIESLKVFCDLAETESFTKAAKINGVTQSAVSQTITTLENHYKALLIERSKKNFRLTTEGEQVYAFSKRILQSYEAIQSRMQELKGIISGTIRVSTVYSIGLHELPSCIKQFLKECPEVNVHVEYRRPNQVYDDVLGNIVDLGLVAYPWKDPKIEIVTLRKDPLVLASHPQNPFAKLKSVKLKALNGQKMISFERDMPTRKAVDKLLKDQGISVQHVMEFDNIETLKGAVEIDSGVALLPTQTVQQEVANQTLAAVRLEGNYYRELGVVYKKPRVLSPAMKQFIEVLKKSL